MWEVSVSENRAGDPCTAAKMIKVIKVFTHPLSENLTFVQYARPTAERLWCASGLMVNPVAHAPGSPIRVPPTGPFR